MFVLCSWTDLCNSGRSGVVHCPNSKELQSIRSKNHKKSPKSAYLQENSCRFEKQYDLYLKIAGAIKQWFHIDPATVLCKSTELLPVNEHLRVWIQVDIQPVNLNCIDDWVNGSRAPGSQPLAQAMHVRTIKGIRWAFGTPVLTVI